MNVLEELGLPRLPEALPRPVADNHTHLDTTTEYSGLQPADSLRLAAQVGVSRVVQVGCDVASSRFAVELANREPTVVATVALHPNDAARTFLSGGQPALTAELQALRPLASAAGVRAIGETGLDHYRTREPEGRRAQEESFRWHIALARELDLTLVVHDRDAHADVLRVIDDEGAPARVVMHCFSGDVDFAQECLERGFWLSYPGVVTFASAENLREAAEITPLEKILVETDAPFLTPKPERGKHNAPYLLPHTVRFLAELLDVELVQFCDAVLANTFAAFGGPWGEPDA